MPRYAPLALLTLSSLAVACDDDDPSDVAEGCRLEVAFLVNGEERCLTGSAESTRLQAGTTTTITLNGGAGSETLEMFFVDLAEGDNLIPENGARYVDPDGAVYSSGAGGRFTVSELDDDIDAEFSFTAENLTDSVAVTRGVIENLQFRG